MQIVTLARKEGVLLHVQNDIMIASRAAEGPGFSVPAEPDPRAVFDSRRNFRLNGALVQHSPFPLALLAWVANHAARTLAGWAGTRHREKSLLIPNLAASLACPAGGGGLPWCRSRAVALFAGLVASD